ncbi:hypothetical protein HZA97_02010 [Candidatus Woesearchaeota archaeon]|nr:hypothetical protein [Candidatus Woesearchaeota archaeon]
MKRRNNRLWIRISDEEKITLSRLATNRGYTSLSEFIRRTLFETEINIHTKLNEIKQILEGGKNEAKEKRNNL